MLKHDHPIFKAKAWGRLDMISLPDDLLRWFSADVAERVGKVKGLSGDGFLRETIHSVRRVSTGEIKSVTIMHPVRDDDFAGSIALHLAKGSAYPAADFLCHLLVDSAGSVAAEGIRDTGVWMVLRAEARKWERKWLLRRLRYLCEVWRDCGARAPHLLYDGTCPIPWEEEEACDGVEA